MNGTNDGPALGHLPPAWPVPPRRQLARLMTTETSELNAEDQLFKVRLLADEPALDATISWAAQQLNALLRHNVIGDLDEILDAADGTMLSHFAAGLRRDFNAISSALALPWTTSPVEALLRARVLHAT